MDLQILWFLLIVILFTGFFFLEGFDYGVGMTLPFILRKLKIDPAVASSPLVTSLADILGVFIYLGIASALL